MLLVAKDGRQYCVARKADLMVVLSDNPEEGKLVRIVLAEGRAFTRLTLEEFCDLILEIRQEISRHHWHAAETQVELTMNSG
jgi:hypothetical protein